MRFVQGLEASSSEIWPLLGFTLLVDGAEAVFTPQQLVHWPLHYTFRVSSCICSRLSDDDFFDVTVPVEAISRAFSFPGPFHSK